VYSKKKYMAMAMAMEMEMAMAMAMNLKGVLFSREMAVVIALAFYKKKELQHYCCSPQKNTKDDEITMRLQ
jgi:hypothetical protein